MITYKDKYQEKEKNEQNRPDIIFFSAHHESFSSKPPSDYIGIISNGILNGYQLDSNIDDLVNEYIAKGKSVSPAVFLGERSKNGFLGASSIFLDFDSKEKIITPTEVYQRLKYYGITPNIFYHTFSHTKQQPKFRFVIALDESIHNEKSYQYLLDGLEKIFTIDDYQYLDTRCTRDIGHIYHATKPDKKFNYTKNDDSLQNDMKKIESNNEKAIFYFSNEQNSYNNLKLAADIAIKTDSQKKHGNGSRKVKDFDIKKFTCKFDVDEYGKPYKTSDKGYSSISKSYYPRYTDHKIKKLTFDYISNIIYKDCGQTSKFKDNYKLLRNIKFSKLQKTLYIVNDFVLGRMKINGSYVYKNFDYNTLLSFSIAFLRIEGGIKWMTQIMNEHNKKNNNCHYKKEDFELLGTLQLKQYKNKYANPNLKNFSPYENDWEYNSIYDAAKNDKRGAVKKNKEEHPQPIDLQEAESKLKDIFKKVLDKEEKGNLDVISAGIGLGKTKLLIDEIDHKKSGAIIAFVTHKMKDQFITELKKKGYSEKKDFIASPQVPEFDDPVHKIQLKHLFIYREFQETKKYIQKICENDTEDDGIKAKQYLDEYKDFTDLIIDDRFRGSIITTHAMVQYFDFHKTSLMHDTYIFDECLFASGLNTDYLFLDDIKSVAESGASCSEAFGKLLAQEKGVYENDIDLPLATIQYGMKKTTKNKGIWKKLLDFRKSNFFAVAEENKNGKTVYKILYILKKKLHPSKNYIVLSGTPIEKLYQFEDINTTIHDECKFVEHKGKLIQTTRKSWSKSSMGKAKKVPENTYKLPVITFQQYKYKFFKAVTDIHINNTLGYNDLTGKDLMVVGTFHMNPYALALLALDAGLPIDLDNKDLFRRSVQNVEYNGMQFRLYIFEDKTLRDLSMQITETTIQQAVGRARLLREEATVYLHSNFPLWQADEFIY